MISKQNSFSTCCFLLLLVSIFNPWFLNKEIIGGDWPYFFSETLKGFTLFPPVWSLVHGNGLGGTILTYYLDQYLYFTSYLTTNILHMPWVIGYKLFWFGFFIALSIFSSIYLLKTIFSRSRFWQMGVAALIFTTNTYILMVVGGGQMGVVLAYSIAPLVLMRFIKLIDFQISRPKADQPLAENIKYAIIAGLILAAQVMFDPRIAYLSMIAVVAYYLINKFQIVSILYTFVIPIGIAVLLHSYWIFPLLVTRTLPIPEGFVSVSGFKFFSFADFSHALPLLHPNWPENIFGKIYFLQPEFLIIPILAFSSLLFTKNKTILFFSFIGLLGAFLAKGANPPFGEINQWLFQYIPGMNMFRDPTKFYLLVALSYSVLIPFSLSKIVDGILSIKYHVLSIKIGSVFYLVPAAFIIFWVFSIHPAIFGQLKGTFEKHEVPKEYIELKDFLYNQPDFFRTLWIPRQQRFTFVSNNHPAIEAIPLFKATNSAQIVFKLQAPESQELLEKLSVKYVVVPYDSIGEIFLKDRKYDEKQRIDLEKQLDNTGWLKKIKTGKIAIYETYSHRDHFWLDRGGKISYRIVSPTQYLVEISTSISDSLTFSENYSPYWTARIGEKYVTSNKTKDGLNSFVLNKVGKYNVEVFYAQEKYFHYGRLVSFATLIVLGIILIVTRRGLLQRIFLKIGSKTFFSS